MNCMKCGRELKGELNFCAACQKDMERFPVSPTTPVQIPVRPSGGGSRKKNRSRRSAKPEERIKRLKSSVRWLVFALVITLIAFGLTVAAVLMLLRIHTNAYASKGTPLSAL